MRYMLAIDSSQASQQAFEVLCKLVNAEKDTVFVISVYEPMSIYEAPRQPHVVTTTNEILRAETRQLLQIYGEKCKDKNFNFTCILGCGLREDVCAEAKKREVDFIVIGRRTLGTLERLLWSGSFSEYCVRNSECSVIVVKEGSTVTEKEWDALIDETTLTNVFTKKEIVAVKVDEDLKRAWDLMNKYKVLSVPVYDQSHRRFLGFLDRPTILQFAMKSSDQNVDNLSQFLGGEKFSTQCGELVAHSTVQTENPYAAVDSSVKLWIALEFMSRKNLKRIPIEEEGQLIGILSEWKVVSFMSHHIHKWARVDETIESLGFCNTDRLLKLKKSTLVRDAVQKICDNNGNSVAIVDDDNENRIVGHLSLSDFKAEGWNTKVSWYFGLTLEKLQEILQRDPARPQIPYHVHCQDRVKKVFDLIVEKHIHCVYVLNNENLIEGFIDLNSLISRAIDYNTRVQ